MKKPLSKMIFALSLSALSGCGTYVPDIQEINQSPKDGQDLFHAIVTNINCEIQDAFYDLHQRYPKTFLDDWGIQTTLSLTFNEKGSFNTSAVGMPPSPASAIFSLAGGVGASSEATRIEKLNYYNIVKTFNNKRCPNELRGGSFILQSDLKLKEWLFDAVQEVGSKNVDFSAITDKGPLKENVISHEVKFEIVSSGSFNPSWKLTRATVNATGSFLTASRDRTQDLLITIGPPDSTYIKVKGKNGKDRTVLLEASPGGQATQIHFSALIGSTFNNSTRTVVLP